MTPPAAQGPRALAGRLRVGTCSWKVDSWRGLVYSERRPLDHLAEYARCYDTVEVDQWFWSLFGPEQVVLPRPEVVRAYAAAVPETFRFSVKVPNSISLTHLYRRGRQGPLVPNPHFLSTALWEAFLQALAPLGPLLGPLILQFAYLNRRQVRDLATLLAALAPFAEALGPRPTVCLELRNPAYLTGETFDFLGRHRLGLVLLQGYHMPPVWEVLPRCAAALRGTVVLRLHGPDREGMEARAGKRWDRLVQPRDEELDRLAGVVRDLLQRDLDLYVNVNNHYEGSAPLTIERLMARLGLPAPPRGAAARQPALPGF